VVLRPRSPDSEIARQREFRAAQLVQQRGQTRCGGRTSAFPPRPCTVTSIRTGTPLNGTDSAGVARLAREGVAEFYADLLPAQPARACLIVGDVTLAEARGSAGRFGGWEAAIVPAFRARPPAAGAGRSVT